jgi:glutaredoxin-related protein
MLVITGARDFIYRAVRDFIKTHPDWPFMPVAALAEQMKVPESVVVPVLEQLHEAGYIEFHPMWPTIREFYVSNEFVPARMETP